MRWEKLFPKLGPVFAVPTTFVFLFNVRAGDIVPFPILEILGTLASQNRSLHYAAQYTNGEFASKATLTDWVFGSPSPILVVTRD